MSGTEGSSKALSTLSFSQGCWCREVLVDKLAVDERRLCFLSLMAELKALA